MKILLVEDDAAAAQILKETLESKQYSVDCAADGETAWELAEAFAYNLILLDVVLPKLDGITFCQKLRAKGDRTPILLLTAQDSSTLQVAGLDAGADDYLMKPYQLDELLARIRAAVRRGDSTSLAALHWGKLCLEPNDCNVTYDGQRLHLTPKEYALLQLFLTNKQRVFSQNALLDHLWSFEDAPSTNAIRAHIKSLRQKLKQAGAVDLIETVHGMGYRLTSNMKTQQPQESQKTANTALNEVSSHSIESRLKAIWEKHQEKYCLRVKTIEQAVAALKTDTLSEVSQQAALREAHTLAGSLGSFGFTEATHICREIEQTLKTLETPTQAEVKHLSRLVQKLWQELSQSPVDIQPKDNLYSSPNLAIANQPVHLLIVDDDEGLASALTSEAKIRGIQTETATTLAHAREILAHTQPDIILLDLSFSNCSENGFELLVELSAVKSPVPVLVFTASESFSDRVQAAKLGGRGFLQKPVSPSEVMDAVMQVLQQSNTPEAKLLIVDDDPQILDFLRTLLSPWGFQLALLDDPQEFWHTLEQFAPDLLILDWEMPNFSGIDLCQVVRADPRWSQLPILFLSAHNDADTLQRVFTSGADDYVNKPIIESELIARILNRLERSKILQSLADIDTLTGLTNRRKSVQDFNHLLRLANRQKQSLCFILLDLDHFKSINDCYGHDTGDKVLKQLAELLKRCFRDEDTVARWGGEEFAIGLYGINQQQCIARMTRFLDTFRQHEFTDTKERKFQVTFSAGIAEYPCDGTNLEELYQVADTQLYKAKVAGRNQILSSQLVS
ncbi:transcriptional regulator [Scytonema hofmannii PCC 7110]|uniref:Transcriptional regulator n=1 Tax=Scytonema hofmannii PCC 7110 TaxID=128403 RepID=A0A139XB11_9CYAN|nr:response regulator [Scytonema hofmannii]KYC41846.1 transcriptional regulator [Scytonema hofmannii PCC 7110]